MLPKVIAGARQRPDKLSFKIRSLGPFKVISTAEKVGSKKKVKIQTAVS